jgi:glycosyltransferase involved in cell wall biosynthesis
MNVCSVTRILNEEDIVEAFVRHNAVHVSKMLFLDNGSCDGTLDILRALQAEGFAITVFQTVAAGFDEVAVNTWLYGLASQLYRADWVIFLDTDEFIDTEILADTLTGDGILVEHIRYVQSAREDSAELIVPVRQRWRVPGHTGVFKMFLRGGLDVVIEAGNHGAVQNGQALALKVTPGVRLAHYSRRDGWQNLQKIATGWLKVLAAGAAVIGENRSAHYRSPFETLREKPHELLGNKLYLDREMPEEEMEEHPLTYHGGPLRYTKSVDPALRAFRLGLNYAEQLATQHGRLLDGSPEARRLTEGFYGERKFLF